MAPIALQLEGQILTSSTRLDGLEGKSLVRGAQEAQSIQKRSGRSPKGLAATWYPVKPQFFNRYQCWERFEWYHSLT